MKNNSLSFLINQLTGAIGKRDASEIPKDIATNFIIDNILKPLINDIMAGINNFLLKNGGLIGLSEKRDAAEIPKDFATGLIGSLIRKK